jgi:hypothetical protein
MYIRLLAASLLALLLSPALPGVGLRRSAAVPTPRVPVEKFTLPNGLRVVLSEDHSAPVVTVYTTFRVGGANEQKGFTGFAHLFEHMMFNGSRNVPEGAYAYYVDATGGDVNANTEHDRTNYYQTVPSNYLEGMLFLESNRMANLEITERALANEKSVVKEEVRQQQENSPYAKVLMLDWPSGRLLVVGVRALDVRVDGGPLERAGAGLRRLLQEVLRAEQRDPGDLRRLRAEAGARAGRAVLRAAAGRRRIAEGLPAGGGAEGGGLQAR